MPEDHKTMLDTQFRCPAIISDFVSKAFMKINILQVVEWKKTTNIT